MQQIKSLIIKRFRIFYRRYILAALILILPFLLEAILSGAISSSSNIVNTSTGKVQTLGKYNLGLANYKTPQILTYHLNDTGFNNSAYIQTFLSSHYSPTSQVTLSQLSTDTVNNYVLDLRKASLDNMLYKYYAGKIYIG